MRNRSSGFGFVVLSLGGLAVAATLGLSGCGQPVPSQSQDPAVAVIGEHLPLKFQGCLLYSFDGYRV